MSSFWHHELEGGAKIFGMVVWGSNLGGDNRRCLIENVHTDCWAHADSNSMGTRVLPQL